MPRRAAIPIDHTRVEYLILADHVEAVNGKLYIMGGGWDTMTVQNLDLPAPLSIGCGVVVPYNETDEDHRLSIAVRTPDATDIAPPLEVGFRTGRAPTLQRGADTHIPFAIRAQFVFPVAGEFSIVASLDDRPGDGRTFKFYVNRIQGVGPTAR